AMADPAAHRASTARSPTACSAVRSTRETPAPFHPAGHRGLAIAYPGRVAIAAPVALGRWRVGRRVRWRQRRLQAGPQRGISFSCFAPGQRQTEQTVTDATADFTPNHLVAEAIQRLY